MKVFTVLAAFAKNEKLGGGHILSINNSLPSLEITDYSGSLEKMIRSLTKKILNIDEVWPVYYKRDFTYDDYKDGERHLSLIYVTYFPDLCVPLHGGKWTKLGDLSELDEISKDIVLLTAQRRY